MTNYIIPRKHLSLTIAIGCERESQPYMQATSKKVTSSQTSLSIESQEPSAKSKP